MKTIVELLREKFVEFTVEEGQLYEFIRSEPPDADIVRSHIGDYIRSDYLANTMREIIEEVEESDNPRKTLESIIEELLDVHLSFTTWNSTYIWVNVVDWELDGARRYLIRELRRILKASTP